MKKGFFATPCSTIFPFLLAFLLLPGCASFLQIGANGEEPGEYDRGYSPDGSSDEVMAAGAAASDTASDTSDELTTEQRRIKRAIEMRDVVLGMTRHDVTESWGTPVQREVAGRGVGGHERWVYGSRYSLTSPRTVIFENGRVAGWSH
jgi:hypothetical protein